MVWSILSDALLVIVFLTVLAFFTKYGLDKALLLLGKSWLSFACSLFIGPKLTGLFEGWFIRNSIVDGVHNSLTEMIQNNANGYNLAELFEKLPEGFVRFLDGLGASLTALEAEFGSYTEAGPEIIRAMAERIATPCVDVVSSIIGHLIGFIVPWLFMKWLDFELRKDRIPFFRFFDHVGGFLTGIILGYAVVLGIALLTRTAFQIAVAFNAELDVMQIYERSFVFRFLGEFDTFGTLRGLLDTVSNTVSRLAG